MKQSNTMTRSSIARVKKIKAKVLPPTAMSPAELRAAWQSTVIGMDVHKGRQAQTAREERWCLNGIGRKLDLWSR